MTNNDRLIVRMPTVVVKAIRKSAKKYRLSTSEYARRCLLERLKRDGFEPPQEGEKWEWAHH